MWIKFWEKEFKGITYHTGSCGLGVTWLRDRTPGYGIFFGDPLYGFQFGRILCGLVIGKGK